MHVFFCIHFKIQFHTLEATEHYIFIFFFNMKFLFIHLFNIKHIRVIAPHTYAVLNMLQASGHLIPQ